MSEMQEPTLKILRVRDYDEDRIRQRITDELRFLAPGCTVGRIWGRHQGASRYEADAGNAWAADPEDIADIVLDILRGNR
jgi:hypothetical protein